MKIEQNMSSFSQAMSQRLEGYERVNSQAQLRQILSAQGGVRAQGDIVAMRLAELKGHPATPDGALKRWGEIVCSLVFILL